MRKLLVANRGEIARRVVRSAQAMGIATVAIFSDADAELPFVREADEAVRLPGNTPAETYLRGEVIVEAALRGGAEAVHPGYGFLSENAIFARACREAGLVFVGPPSDAIASMGDKLAAKETVQAAGVPTLESARIDTDDPEILAKMAQEIGTPVLLKAAAGGGGRGMRVVQEPGAVAEVAASARREAQSAFGDGTIFMERYLPNPRHIEVQVLGDAQGTVVHLFERECSIQRRHQKIVEESPSSAVSAELREAMGEAAVRAARSVGYEGAGTVEFLLAEDGTFYFLEMNTRLQVEHPVTEAVTGLDLVALQLSIAMNRPIPPEVVAARQSGHAIEVRLYAEDPTNEWMPSTGRLHTLEIPEAAEFSLGQGLRLDSGYESGSTISPFYDPMLAKLISWGPTREVATMRLARALERARLHGPVTNRDLLVRILRHPDFAAGRTDTGFLSRHDPAVLGVSPLDESGERLHAAAAAIADQEGRRAQAVGFAGFPSGWRNNPSQPQLTSYRGALGDVTVRYSVSRDGAQFPDVPDIEVISSSQGEVVLQASGVRRRCRIVRVADTVYVDSALGASALQEIGRFPDAVGHHAPGSLLSPMPGTVVRVAVGPGDRVEAGDTLVVLEAMKMEHTLSAPCAGVVTEVRAAAGEQVDAAVVLVVVEGDSWSGTEITGGNGGRVDG